MDAGQLVQEQKQWGRGTYVFDVGARVDSDDITVLDAEIVADDPVDTCAAIVEVVVGKDDQNSVLSLLALDENGVATEELEGFHRVVGKGNDGIVIVGGIGNTVNLSIKSVIQQQVYLRWTHIRELGFFFFLRIAVDTSFSTCCRISFRTEGANV